MEFLMPTTKAEALEHLARYGEDAVIMAGGTYLLYEIEFGFKNPAAIVHLGRIQDLSSVEDGERISIGAAATHRSIATLEVLGRYSALPTASSTCGGWQTQSVGTLGGNVCTAHHTADLMAPLLIHGAQLTLESVRGKRKVSLEAFVLGPQRTQRGKDELLSAIDLDPMPDDAVDAFFKVRRRHAMDSAILSVAARFALPDPAGPPADVRIAVGGGGPVPYRARDAETLLAEGPLTDEAIEEASRKVAALASPKDDSRGSAAYRAAVLPRVCARVLRDAKAAAERSVTH
jgi:carbon-monoxide dehydrogenase medium subunit